MLWTIIVILLVLWLLGLVTSYTMGGLIPHPVGPGGHFSCHPPRSRPKGCLSEEVQK